MNRSDTTTGSLSWTPRSHRCKSTSGSIGSPTLKSYINQLARHGGYSKRASDGPSDNTGGVSRLTDIELGYPWKT